MSKNPPKAIVQKAKLIRGKRARIVVEHILKHGSITSEDLERYGYEHPPRAIRDVREQGLPLETFWTKRSDGRKIAGYRFGNPKDIRHDRLGGRLVFPKDFIRAVVEAHDSKCAICLTPLEKRYLQIDHRVPYEIAGDIRREKLSVSMYMPLCGSCNRAKSWSCEHCRNWKKLKDARTCLACYWADPERYEHIAMREMRRLDVVWEGREVADFDKLARTAGQSGAALPRFVKDVLRRHIHNKHS